MKRKFIFLTLLIFSLAFMPLFAQTTESGQESISLFEIDKLIRRTEYDEALRQINIYMANHPDNFDAAQIRIKRIMNARISYSELAEKLIYLIQTDPGNDKEIYELTSKLESFEKNPSDENLQFIADLKKSAEFNYFRSLFMQLQTEASQLALKGSYSPAIDKLKEGFWLYKDDFYEEWGENPEVIQKVEATLVKLDDSLKLYQEKNYLTRINDSIAAFIKSVNQDQYEDALSRFQEIKSQFSDYYSIRASVAKVEEDLNNQFEDLKKQGGEMSDASYLPFLCRFITGLSSLENSGILGAMDKYWTVSISQMNDAVYAMLNKKYQLFEEGVNSTYLASVTKYADLEKSVISLCEIASDEQNSQFALHLEDYLIQADYLKALASGALRLADLNSDIEILHQDSDKLIANLKEKDVDDESIAGLFSSILNISELLGVKEEQKLENVSWGEQYRNKEFEVWTGLSELYTRLLDSAFDESAIILTSVWQEIASAFYNRSDAFLAFAKNDTTSISAYYEGLDDRLSEQELSVINQNIIYATEIYKKTDSLGLGIKYAYPDIALNVCTFTRDYINRSIKSIDSYGLEMRDNYNAHPQWREQSQIKTIVDDSLTYFDQKKKELQALLNQINTKEPEIAKKRTSAQLARNEADVRYKEAEEALKRDDFDTARRKLQDALTKYNESLTNQDDEKFSLTVDEKLLSLGERITKAENEIVVRDVRELKNLAKDAYFNGRFDDAEKYLNEAKNRWAITNVTEDEEIRTLLAFVETALSMNTGRVILPSAPQYPEMSQLLNISNQYYDEGKRLLKEGDKEAAEEAFRSALTSIRKVQYVYPLNQEAALLTLKINRELDPQKFREEFSQKIEAARLLCQKADTRQEGYANLLDYYELEPSYKGLKDLIYKVEIDIGIRQKPVTKTGENSAKKLISQAQTLYRNAGNNTSSLKKALNLVDQALTMLPDDKSAMALKDSITTKIGGNTVPVLSTEEERLYQLAVQRLQSNNVVGARALVNQILKKSQNANIQKIKDLLTKIEARS
ncbi:MAG: hypothetical protein K5681_08655 [Treponema sp.]|nr:hypothetical protein [Treponema sp.]